MQVTPLALSFRRYDPKSERKRRSDANSGASPEPKKAKKVSKVTASAPSPRVPEEAVDPAVKVVPEKKHKKKHKAAERSESEDETPCEARDRAKDENGEAAVGSSDSTSLAADRSLREMCDEVSAHFQPKDPHEGSAFLFNFDLSDDELPDSGRAAGDVPCFEQSTESHASDSQASRKRPFLCFNPEEEDNVGDFFCKATPEEMKARWDQERSRIREIVRSATKHAVWKAKEVRNSKIRTKNLAKKH